MSTVVGFSLIWALCGVWAYGQQLAYWQGRFPSQRERGDLYCSLVALLFGPVGLLMNLVTECYGYGLQFRPKPPERESMSMFSTRMGYTERNTCPECGVKSIVTSEERANDCWTCTSCGGQFRLSTGERVPHDLGEDEPDWSEPSASDLAWAQATMPGKASGHTVGWRLWWLHENTPRTAVDGLDTATLAKLSDAELCAKLSEIQNDIIQARSVPPYILLSGNDARWEPGQPIVGHFHKGMPRAHGAGIYAMKECPTSCQTQVIGKVALWGSVVEHENGYRARYAYPLELWCDSQAIADALSKHYGVTCHGQMPEGVERLSLYDRYAVARQQALQKVLNAQRSMQKSQYFGQGGGSSLFSQIFGGI